MSAPTSRLAPGATLGPYEIVELLGAGGMGEVYRARDRRLDRAVAVKVLPETRAGSAEMRQRLEREARAISALQHPHICTLHDVGREGDTDFLVMELLEGESLATRLLRGGLPLEQVLRVGREVAEALDYAHRRGVVHRDLKPGNVMLTRAGAKLLDFGLARLHAPDPSAASRSVLARQPTEDHPLTAEGTILGTFQYMAPEQLEGREADARTDLFALGAVLHEMATGRKAFEGKSQASLIAAIMSSEPPPVSSVQKLSPPALDRLVRTCLAKDADDRWQSAHDVAAELRWIAEAGSQAGAPATVVARRRSREGLAWAAAVAAALAAAGLWLMQARSAPSPSRTVRLHLAPPAGARFESQEAPVAISADGRRLVFGVDDADQIDRLWVRDLDRLDSVPLPGTEGAYDPFWSPDGREVGFFDEGRLLRVDASGAAPPQTICTIQDGRGASWSRGGTILFVSLASGGIWRVNAAGGEPRPVTTLDVAEEEIAHEYPQFLPDGEHFLYFVRSTKPGRSGIYAGKLEGELRRMVIPSQGHARFAAPGFLLHVRGSTLVAQPFDPQRLESSGEATPVAQGVEYVARYDRGSFSASEQGILVYHGRGSGDQSDLRWFDRAGVPTDLLGASGSENIDLEPSGRRLAAMRMDEATRTADIWIYELERGVWTRLTAGEEFEIGPVWSPDGSRIAYTSVRRGKFVLVDRAVDGGAERVILQRDTFLEPVDWSPDGRFLVYESPEPGHRMDLRLLSLADGASSPLAATRFDESSARFSPDGGWVSYESDETGRSEVYLQPMPPTGARHLVSTGGGRTARWRSDGGELYFIDAADRLVAVEVPGTGSLSTLTPRPLFAAPSAQYEPLPGGQRFLFSTATLAHPEPLVVVLGWDAPTRR